MGEIVNLRLKRKAKKRDEAADKAAENRLSYGRRKDDQKLSELLNAQARKALDGHQRED